VQHLYSHVYLHEAFLDENLFRHNTFCSLSVSFITHSVLCQSAVRCFSALAFTSTRPFVEETFLIRWGKLSALFEIVFHFESQSFCVLFLLLLDGTMTRECPSPFVFCVVASLFPFLFIFDWRTCCASLLLSGWPHCFHFYLFLIGGLVAPHCYFRGGLTVSIFIYFWLEDLLRLTVFGPL
jgi:hypothetical protein